MFMEALSSLNRRTVPFLGRVSVRPLHRHRVALYRHGLTRSSRVGGRVQQTSVQDAPRAPSSLWGSGGWFIRFQSTFPNDSKLFRQTVFSPTPKG